MKRVLEWTSNLIISHISRFLMTRFILWLLGLLYFDPSDPPTLSGNQSRLYELHPALILVALKPLLVNCVCSRVVLPLGT